METSLPTFTTDASDQTEKVDSISVPFGQKPEIPTDVCWCGREYKHKGRHRADPNAPKRSRSPQRKKEVRLTQEELYALVGRSDADIAKTIRAIVAGGRPAAIVDPMKVLQYRACGCSEDEIAALLHVSKTTFRAAVAKDKLLQKMFEAGMEYGKGQLRSAQYVKAVIKGDTTMLIWMGKQMLGQRDEPGSGGSTDRRGHMAELVEVMRGAVVASQAVPIGSHPYDACEGTSAPKYLEASYAVESEGASSGQETAGGS